MNEKNFWGIGHIALKVKNYSDFNTWLTTLFSAECYRVESNSMFFKLGNTVFVIKWENSGEEVKAGNLDHYGIALASMEHVNAVVNRHLQLGMELVKEPYKRSDGYAAYVKDPDGNICELFFLDL